jgi:superfamily II DNA or RNA helicase
MSAVWTRAVIGGWGALLADEVGLGKTLVSLGVIARLAATGKVSDAAPAIVVAPASVALQWLDEARAALAAPPSIVVVQGDASTKMSRLTSPHSIYVLTWELLILPRYRQAVAALARRAAAVVLDESSRIKTPSAKVSRAAAELFRDIRVRVLLNATPLETRAEDLWSQFRVLDHRVLGPIRPFRDRYLITRPTSYGEKVVGHKSLPELRVRTAHAVLRRTRAEVGHDLPVEAVIRRVVFDPRQAAVYREAAAQFLAEGRSGAVAASRIAAVQRAAWSAMIGDRDAPSAKFDALFALLADDLADDRAVVFSRLATIVHDAAARLSAATDRRVFTITGKDSPADRAYARRVFDGTPRAVIVATSAAERGLNLQAAPAVVHLDLPWTYAALRQRVGRVARIGQAAESVLSISVLGRVRPDRPALDDWIAGLLSRRKAESQDAVGPDSSDDLGRADVEDLRRFLAGNT